MRIVIDIDEDYVKIINKNGASNYPEERIVNGIKLPNNATNGDVIKAMFSNDSRDFLIVNMDKNSWWNAPYKADKESD